MKAYLGDCRDEALVEKLFGSVAEFTGLVELLGDDFTYGKVTVTYNDETDTHAFYTVLS